MLMLHHFTVAVDQNVLQYCTYRPYPAVSAHGAGQKSYYFIQASHNICLELERKQIRLHLNDMSHIQ
jgi:hypothetical protein